MASKIFRNLYISNSFFHVFFFVILIEDGIGSLWKKKLNLNSEIRTFIKLLKTSYDKIFSIRRNSSVYKSVYNSEIVTNDRIVIIQSALGNNGKTFNTLIVPSLENFDFSNSRRDRSNSSLIKAVSFVLNEHNSNFRKPNEILSRPQL